MRNLFYYLKQYGNLSFKENPFNEVDSLILCQISYLNLENYLSQDDEMNLVEILNEKNYEILIKETFSPKKNIKLMQLLKKSDRFKSIFISHLRSYLNYEKCVQFYAVTYHIDDFLYICFRGTDLSLIGWKEDFNMAYLKEVPSQKYSVFYLDEIFQKYHKPMYVGGHSKGGNLALYSSMHSCIELNPYIIKIYNFDGPGYVDDIFSNKEYLDLKDKVITMTTKEAVIGVLLYHETNLIFIHAKGFSILQHEPYNWIVEKSGKLKRVKRNSLSSRWFEQTVRHFFLDTNEEERKRFIDILFHIVEVNPKVSINDFRYHPLRFLLQTRKRYKKIRKEDKIFFKKTLKKFRKSFYHTVKTSFSLNE